MLTHSARTAGAMAKLLLVDYQLPLSSPVKAAVLFSPVLYHGHGRHAEEIAAAKELEDTDGVGQR